MTPPATTTTMTTTTPTLTQPQQQAVVPPAETVEEEVETVEQETVAQAPAVEDANARTVDPDVLEEQDDRFDVANPDDIVECNGDQHARKWQWCELKKATLLDEEVSVGTGARQFTWKVRFDIKASDVNPVYCAEFPDVVVCNFDFTTQSDTTKTTASGSTNPKKKKTHRKQKKRRINFVSLSTHLWPGKWEDQLKQMNNRVLEGQLWDDEDKEAEGIEQPACELGEPHMLKCCLKETKKVRAA
jgi:hypothetical protein